MVKLINLSLGRTGTMSLKQALEDLGFNKCYHFSDILFSHPEHTEIWEALARGEEIDWESLFEGYQATTYWSTSYDYMKVLEQYPDVKFILTVREPNAWYKSTYDTVYSLNRLTPERDLEMKTKSLHDPKLRSIYAGLKLQEKLLWQTTFQGRFEDKEFAIQQFENHIQRVKDTVPADRLLVYKIQQGWQPICDFFDLPVPDKAFPRVNDTDSFIKLRQTISIK